MGLFSIFSKRLKHSGTQADTFCAGCGSCLECEFCTDWCEQQLKPYALPKQEEKE